MTEQYTPQRGEQGRCSGELCSYTLPLIDGLVVGHSKTGVLDVCEGGGRPPLPPPVTTPGDLLAVLLRDRGITQAALATTLDRPPQMVSEIVAGKKRVTATTAVQLQRVFGLPALVWLGLQAHVDTAGVR